MDSALDDNFLREYLGEHFVYEIEMPFYSINKLAELGKANDQLGVNLSLECFIAHGRNLVEFYYYPKKDRYIRATHYIDKNVWETMRPQKTDNIRELERRASNEMVHLTMDRISGTPPEKRWNCGPCFQDLLILSKCFLDNIPEKYKSTSTQNWTNRLAHFSSQISR